MIVAVLLLMSSIACDDTNADIAPVYLTVTEGGQATHFAIPKAYLIFAPNRRGGEQSAVLISVSLPDIQPDFAEKYLPAIRTALGADGVPQFRQKTGIYLHRGRPNVKRLFRRDIESEVMTHNSGETLFGLRKFTYTRDVPSLSASGGFFKGSVFYLLPPQNIGNHGLYFECFTEKFLKKWTLPTKCRGSGNYNENLYYNYNVPKHSLEHWKALDANVRALLELFERRAKLAYYPDGGG